MKKLVDTPEAQAYDPEIRCEIMNLVGARLLFEWRYWCALVAFIIIGTIALGVIERADLTWIGRLLIGSIVILPGALLWTYVSYGLHRWILSHRSAELLHAVISPPAARPTSDTE